MENGVRLNMDVEEKYKKRFEDSETVLSGTTQKDYWDGQTVVSGSQQMYILI